jgi:hypothetical protein
VKRHLPHVKFIVGGTGISDAQDVLLTDPRFYDFIDYPVVGDGEEALTLCLDAIAGKASFDAVPGLWTRKDGKECKPATSRLVDMDASPCPDYRDVDFSHYMLPEKAGFYTTSRGRYYGKCTFCPESFRVGFRMRSPENVYADIRKIVAEQGVKYIHFFDPLTPPRTLAHLSREVAREALPLKWHAEVKFEKIYTSREYMRNLSQGGCSLLQFGFESGVQRVLDGMQKGNKLDQIELMLDNLHDHRINVAVTWFIGFPTESEEDARETWRYLRRHSDRIHLSLYTGTFGLGHDVPVFQHPEDYDIKLLFDAEGNPTYERNDGSHWDQQPLHKSYHVRSDIPLAISGAGASLRGESPRTSRGTPRDERDRSGCVGRTRVARARGVGAPRKRLPRSRRRCVGRAALPHLRGAERRLLRGGRGRYRPSEAHRAGSDDDRRGPRRPRVAEGCRGPHSSLRRSRVHRDARPRGLRHAHALTRFKSARGRRFSRRARAGYPFGPGWFSPARDAPRTYETSTRRPSFRSDPRRRDLRGGGRLFDFRRCRLRDVSEGRGFVRHFETVLRFLRASRSPCTERSEAFFRSTGAMPTGRDSRRGARAFVRAWSTTASGSVSVRRRARNPCSTW